jgi:site-specific recombinase XerD
MLRDYFHDEGVIARLQSTILGDAMDEFVARLRRLGYARMSIRPYARGVGHFAYWLKSEGQSVAAITDDTVHRFLEGHLPRCRCDVPRSGTGDLRSCLAHLMVSLREHRRIPPPPAVPQTPAQELLAEFAAHLRDVRGTTPKTATLYLAHARRFLSALFGARRIAPSHLTQRAIIAHLQDRATSCGRQSLHLLITSIRSLLRFLVLEGRCEPVLSTCLPRVAIWKHAGIPETLSDEQLERVLGAFDLSTPTGLRDHAMALCLARLGLRGCDVGSLALDDIDWRLGTLRIAGRKSRRESVLPLPADVGRAIVAYLRTGRPAASVSQVFVTHVAPLGMPLTSHAIGAALRRALRRAHVRPARKGTHIFRHSAATRMLRDGTTLKELADVLGHRSIDTTVIYTKLDFPQLAEVALPWPEVRP